MTKIMRWNPTRDALSLFNEFDRMLDRSWGSTLGDQIGFGVDLDVIENDANYVVKASVPGVDAENLDITLEDNVLTINGEVTADELQENENYHVRERRFGRFSRSLRFPMLVNADDVEADYNHGVLTITVPKAEEVKPKRITIKADGQS